MHSILTTQVSLQFPPLPWHQRFNFLHFLQSLFCVSHNNREQGQDRRNHMSLGVLVVASASQLSLQGGCFPRDTTPTQSGLGTVGEGRQSDAVAGSRAGIQRRFPHKLRVGPQAGRQITGGSARFACKGRGLKRVDVHFPIFIPINSSNLTTSWI